MAAASAREGNGLLVFGGIGLVAYLAYTKLIKPGIVTPLKTKQFIEKLRLGKITNVKLKKDTVELDFPVENPNSEPMVIRSIVGDLVVHGPGMPALKIGTVNHYGTDTIKPNAATPFQLVAKINLLNEFTILSKIFAGGAAGSILTFTGTVNANNRPWPVTQSVAL